MSDKAREDFEEWFESTGINRTFSEALFSPWLAAKEKYEPKNYLLDDRSLLMQLSVMDGDRIKTIAKLIPVIEAEHSEAKVIEWQAVRCWHELTAPSTQGGGE